MVGPHRGVTHSLLVTVVVTYAGVKYYDYAGLPILFGLCFGWGWLSHLVLDAFTEMGLPDLAWPFSDLLSDIFDQISWRF
jgi:membrane-bound metal-dependent hydrolase YbcI (DUF457 family)